MTLLQLLQQYCLRQALPVPQLIMASADDTYLQLAGLLNEVLDDLSAFAWPELTHEIVFRSVAGEKQGSLETLAPGYLYILNNTLYNRSNNTKVYGPLSPQDWQARQAMPSTGPHYQYRIRGQELCIYPDIEADQTIAFEYFGAHSVTTAGMSFPDKRYFSSDTDTCIFDPMLLLLGIRWKWKYEKGFRYAEDFRQYEAAVTQARAHNTTKAIIHTEGTGDRMASPAVLVPSGTWSVP